jgi:HK97 family phage major capsid protein
MDPVSVLTDIDDISRRVNNNDDVSPLELREWMRSRGDLGPIGGVKREMHYSVLRNYRLRYMDNAQVIVDSSEGKNMTADEQRRFNREMANVGEVSKLMIDSGEPDTEHERIANERFSPEGKRRTSAMLLRGENGGTPTREENHKGVILPSFAEYKSQSVASGPGGGYLVPEVNSRQFFDRLRPQSVVLSAGPREINVDTETTLLPKIGSSVTAGVFGEAATITASDIALETVRLSMLKFGTRTIGSSEWFADAKPDARQIVQMDHERSIAAAIDLQMLEGTGVNQLMGLRRQTGVNVTTLGSPNGAAPTLDDVADAIYRMEKNNARPSVIFMHPRSWNTLKKLQDLQDRYQLQPDPTAEARRSLFGVPVSLSSQISIADTAGSNSDTSYILLVDMSRVVVGIRSTLQVLYDPFSLSSTDQIVVRTTSRWGVALLDEEGVEVIAGVRT